MTSLFSLFHSERSFATRARAVCSVLISVLASACSTQTAPQEPSASTQLLLERSLDRAISQIEVSRFAGRRVDVDLITQSGNRDFAKEFVKERLRERGVVVSAEAPEEKLEVIANVLGTDRGETLIGIPATYVPVIGVGSPELALFKWVRNRGLVELEVDALQAQGGEVVERLGPVVGSAKRDDYTVLLFISFTVTDTISNP